MRALARGLSLVETIVAAGLISTILLLCMGMIPSFKLSNRRAGMELQAATLAQSALENARLAKFADLTDSSRSVTLDAVTYQEQIQVTDSPSGLAKTVRVVVSWSWQEKNHALFRESVICHVPRS